MFNINELHEAARQQLLSLGRALVEKSSIADVSDEICIMLGGLYCSTFTTLQDDPQVLEAIYARVIDPVMEKYLTHAAEGNFSSIANDVVETLKNAQQD